jgi:hypothetical protein
VADARPVAEYCNLLEGAGLRVTLTESHDHALAKMIAMIDARLSVLAMTDVPGLQGVDLVAVRDKVKVAARAVDRGVAGYSLIAADKTP